VEANESSFARFTCAVDTSNYSGGKWLYTSREISPDDSKYTIKTEGKTQELSIKDLTKADRGSYAYVTGSNSKTEAKLFVNSVTIVESLQNLVGTETAAVEMKVVMSHEGIKGTWSKNEQPIKVRTVTANLRLVQIYEFK